jgi:hypothetical protein
MHWQHFGIISASKTKRYSIQSICALIDHTGRLWDGGTRLSSFELVAFILKGFSWEMESFLEDIIRNYGEIGIGQDELIKLIFILQDNHRKEMLNVSADDANFAINNRERIKPHWKLLRSFYMLQNVMITTEKEIVQLLSLTKECT